MDSKYSDICVIVCNLAFIQRSTANTNEYTVSVQQCLSSEVLKLADKWKETSTGKSLSNVKRSAQQHIVSTLDLPGLM